MRTTNWPLWLAVIFALNFGPGIARAGDISPRCPYPVSTAISALMKNVPDAVVFEFRGRNALLAVETG